MRVTGVDLDTTRHNNEILCIFIPQLLVHVFLHLTLSSRISKCSFHIYKKGLLYGSSIRAFNVLFLGLRYVTIIE